MRLPRESVLKRVLHLVAVLPLALLAVVPTLAQTSPPAVVSSLGYIQANAQTTHISAPFKTTGASTLVAFVSSHPFWNGLPVSISGLSDNQGNTWNLLSGPTTFFGSSFTLLSAIYYVNAPATSAAYTLTVQLTNPAPLVFHIFAVSGSDVTGPPISSAITDPGAGGTSADVTTAPITVPTDTLLLSWVKNETAATAIALDGYTLDPQSVSFLWAESETPISAGSYTGDFQYDSAIGWQTAVVGLKPSAGPVAFNQFVMTDEDTPVGITLTATSPQNLPLTYTVLTEPTHGALSGSAPNLVYTPNTGYVGSDAFTFNANDGAANSNTATVSIGVRGPAPVVVSSLGYINGNPQTTHISAPFNTTGSSTLVAFVSTNTPWLGLPVSISGLSDNQGNTWNLLSGPTTFFGSSFTLLSTIYYVNAPITSATHTVTVQLTNPAPLVFHIFAVSGSDVTGPPISSAITDPGAGGISVDVTTAPITVPTNALLLSWVKNETAATATALNGYTLDPQSTSFLWAETETPLGAGSYTGQFEYNAAIGWQTAVVGLKLPIPPPVITSMPANPTNQTSASFSFTDTESGVSFLCQLDGSAFSACSSPAVYSGLGQGNHTFSVKAQDATGSQSTAASFNWTVDTTPPPPPTLNSTPTNPTTQTNASFSFTDTESGVSFLCQLDGSAFSACSSSATYPGPLAQGSHTFSVKAQDTTGNQSAAASFTWTINTTAPPQPTITSAPTNPTNQTSATFNFTDTKAGVSFLCQLDGSSFRACTSPQTYSGLSQGSHTFAVEAKDTAGNPSSASSFTWTISPPDFTWTGSGSRTVLAGQTTHAYNFTATPASGATTFAGDVTLVCSGLPDPTTVCVFSTGQADPTKIATGSGPTAVSLTITTKGPNTGTGAAMRHRADKRSPWPWLPLTLPVAGLLAGLAGRKVSRHSAFAGLCVSLAMLGLMLACGGGSSGGPSPPPTVTVTVIPISANLFANVAGNAWPTAATQMQFAAQVIGATDQTVTWAVTGGSANGAIDATGLFTAPATPPNPATTTITATSSGSHGQAVVNIQRPTALGTFKVTVTASEGTLAHSQDVTLTVQ